MQFLAWYYTKGFEHYIDSWLSTFDYVNHSFSLPLLLKTLFAPWKRLIDVDRSPGFNLQKKFEVFTFNMISRCIGAVVRFTLIWVGMVLIVLTFLAGVLGLIFWTLLPFLGLGIYKKYKNHPKHFVERLMLKTKLSSQPLLKTLFENEAGRFVLTHTELILDDLVQNANEKNLDLNNFKPETYQQIIERLIENNLWSGEFFNKREMSGDDFILAASWWDRKKIQETQISKAEYGRPGFAVELTYGYTPTLNQYSLDLSAPQSFSHRLIGRHQIVSRMERILTSGNSVLLMGQPGVGKKTVILEFAHRAVTGQFGNKMSYKRILEFDYNALLSGTKDLNHKKTKLAQILAEGAAAGNVILMIRDIQRLTNAEVEGYDFTDIFEEYLEKRELKIIAVSTNTDYERFIAGNLRLAKYIEKVEVVPPTKEEALEILVESAQVWESRRYLTITVTALRIILDESDRYVTETPFPEKALELLEAVVTYCEQQDRNIITVDDVNVILAEKTGISFAKLTSDEKERLGKIEEIIHERLVDQMTAVKLIGKTLRAKTVGVIKEDRPLGSFLFLGPTGVGKTETAKVLAKVYYGSTKNILRFDMAEYSGGEGLERLIGSVNNNQPGILTTAIKNRPANILLLDEMEKASPEICNLFLALLDEGMMTDAFGKKIGGRHLFVIGTSNAGAEFVRQLVNKGVTGQQLQEKTINYILEQRIFSPEFLNRFDGVVVYEPLRHEDLVKIAHLMLTDLAENLKSKNIYLQFGADVAIKLAEDGYDPAFGARPMRKIVNLTIGDLLGRAILTDEIVSGDRIKLLVGKGKEEFGWEKG